MNKSARYRRSQSCTTPTGGEERGGVSMSTDSVVYRELSDDLRDDLNMRQRCMSLDTSLEKRKKVWDVPKMLNFFFLLLKP